MSQQIKGGMVKLTNGGKCIERILEKVSIFQGFEKIIKSML